MMRLFVFVCLIGFISILRGQTRDLVWSFLRKHYLCDDRQLWELRKLGIRNWEFPFFPVVCVRNYWMIIDTNECQYILVHKILLQSKLYHCNSLLSTYIQQNNQKVVKNKTNLPITLLFRLVTSLSPFSRCFAKPRISKWDFPDTTVPNSISDWEI